MDREQSFIPKVSLHLSRALDEIGLNSCTVEQRRKSYLHVEQVLGIGSGLAGNDLSIFHFGSQTEGSTTPGLKSDLDMLICLPTRDTVVIEDWSHWKCGKSNLLILQEDAPPGYCRLQLLRSDVPMPRGDVPTKHYTLDEQGRVVLNNAMINTLFGQPHMVRNGPAMSARDMFYEIDVDNVIALKCDSWSKYAAFTRRPRRYSWPSQGLIQEAISHEIFLVAVGSKLSSTENLEWRISSSLAERCFMFSLTTVHIKCYVVLKMLMKTYVEPHVKKCISSYHCKTAVLYCSENTEVGIWRDDNLYGCIKLCLQKLLCWVSELFCPQYIDESVNLFAGKVTDRNRGLLQSILTDVITSNGRALLQVGVDNIGERLTSRLGDEPSHVPDLESKETVNMIGLFKCNEHDALNDWLKTITCGIVIEKETPSAVINSVYAMLGMLKSRLEESDEHAKTVLRLYIERFSFWLGSLMSSVLLSHEMDISREVMWLLRNSTSRDAASLLKLASVFYCKGNLLKVESVLHTVEHRFVNNQMRPICQCYERSSSSTEDFMRLMYTSRDNDTSGYFAHCVRFSPQEIHCTPPAMRHELHRSMRDDIQHRDPANDGWMILAAVDCLPYLHYLQYITYRQLGKQDLQTRTLFRLDSCVRARDFGCYGHLETAWNLLGQCYELELDNEAAMACYRTSLEIRPRNNAANWHVQNLQYSRIRSGDLSV